MRPRKNFLRRRARAPVCAPGKVCESKSNHVKGKIMNRMLIVIALLAVTAASAASDDHSYRQPFQGPRAVYTETNAADSNEILVYSRDHDGDLRLTGRV